MCQTAFPFLSRESRCLKDLCKRDLLKLENAHFSFLNRYLKMATWNFIFSSLWWTISTLLHKCFQNKDKTFSNWKSFYTKWKDASGCVKQWSVSAVLLFHRCSFQERNHTCCTSVFPIVQWIVCSLQTLAYWPMWNKTLIIHCKERPDCYYMVESIWFVHTKWDQTLRVQQASTTKRDEHSQIYHHWDVVCTRLYCLMRLRFQSHPEKTVTEITRLHAWISGGFDLSWTALSQ